MESVKYASNWDEAASRIELVVRWLWLVPLYVGMFVLSLVSCYVLLPVQFVLILCLGKRNAGISNFLHNFYFTHWVNTVSYLFLVTDERPPILPASMVNVRLDYVFSEQASRLELVVRFFYMIILSLVAAITGAIALAGWAVQALLVLFTGRRNRQIWDFSAMWLRYLVGMSYYTTMQTDERPGLMPA